MADIDEGVYEIRSLASPNNWTLDAENAGTASPTNVLVWEPKHSNNQRWSIAKDSRGGYLIQCVGTKLYLDVYGAVAQNEQNVDTYAYNDYKDAIALRWNIVDTGETHYVEGISCKVVALYGCNGSTYALDKYGMDTGDEKKNRNVQLYQWNGGNNQKWILWPCSEVTKIGTPTNIKLTKSIYSNATSPNLEQGDLFASWTLGDAKNLTFDWRYRYRSYSDGAWGGFGAWSAWKQNQSCYSKGGKFCPKETIDCSFAFSQAAKREYQIQACARKSGKVGSIGGGTSTVYRKPTISLSGAAWSPDGLRITLNNDYSAYGDTSFLVHKLAVNGTVRKSGMEYSTDDTDGYILIPQSKLGFVPAEGDKVAVYFDASCAGSAYWTDWASAISGTATVSYDTGTVDVTPTVTAGKGATKVATVPYTNTVRMWMVVNGSMSELTGIVSGGKTSFQIAYPFGVAYRLYTVYNSDSDSTDAWGVSCIDMPASESERIHAWDWDGGALALWLDTDLVKESRDYSLSTDTHTLAGRSKPAVSILSDSNGDSYLEISGSVSGVLLPDDKYNCTVDDVEALLKAGHARYRSPNGRIAQVAVTGASVETNHAYSSVSIDQTEVG